MPDSTIHLTRRQLLAGAAPAPPPSSLEPRGLKAQASSSGTIVFSHTTVVNADAVQHDVALAVEGDKIAAIGETDAILQRIPGPRSTTDAGKALLPGLINCHAHLGATLARGFNEDFGFPNAARLAVQPESLLPDEEATLMAVMGALESIRSGATTVVEYTGSIGSSAAALADTGLRWVFAESVRDVENGPARCPRGVSPAVKPRGSHPNCETRAAARS